MESRGSKIATSILKTIRIMWERINVPGLNLYYKALVIKIVWYWWRSRDIDEEYRRKNQEIDLHKYN